MDDDQIEDFICTFNNTMPAGKTQRAPRPKSSDQNDKTDKRKTNPKVQKSNFRKAHRDLNIKDRKDPLEDRRKQDEKLLKELSDIVGDYSQQRMRALHMSLRQYGNDEGRMSSKEMIQSLQENNITLPSAILKPLISKFDSTKGIDLESLFRFLMESHGRTGRDSVLAMHKRNDLAPRNDISQDDIDDDLLWRIESQLIKSQEYIDLAELRKELQKRDLAKCGIIDAAMLKHVCNDLQLPVFGALLKNLMKRCDEDKNEKVCWPEFLSFLERAQESAKVTCPSLKTLPEKLKSRTPVEPSPIDELSSKTRISIVNKLRKRSTNRHPEVKPNEQQEKVMNGVAEKNVENISENKENDTYINGTSEETLPDQSSDQESSKVLVQDKGGENIERDPSLATLEVSQSDVTSSQISQSDVTSSQVSQSDVTSSQVNQSNVTSSQVNQSDVTSSQVSQSDVTSSQDGGSAPSSSVDMNMTTPDKSDENVLETSQQEKLDEKLEENENNTDCSQTGDDPKVVSANGDINNDADGEMVTFKNGEIVSKEFINEENLDNHHVKTVGEQTVVSIEVKGKKLSFSTDQEYLNQQLIDPPRERMKLQWVYGYRGNDCRKNIHVLASGEILYFMSYIAIMYNKATHSQRLYKEHTDDIKCIDVHSNKLIVASGQYANRRNASIKALVRVWRSDNLHTLHILGENIFEKSVACIAFAPNKDLIAVVDNSLEKKLTVWDTTDGSIKGQDVLHTDLVCDIGFNPKYSETLVTVGKEHTCWWKIYPDSETIQASAKPEYDTFLRAKFVICLTFNDKGDLITGDSNGTIYVFGDGGNRITNFIKHAHDGPVFTVIYNRGYILSGGRDGIIHSWQWGKNMNSAGFTQMPKTEGGVRMLCVSKNSSSVLVGTTMNSMLSLNIADDEAPLQDAHFDNTPVTQCHYDELRGVTTCSSTLTDVFTAGLDGIVCGYNSKERKAMSKTQFKGNQYLCVDVDSTRTLLSLGTKDGHLQILQRNNEDIWQEIINRKICKSRIDCIKLSPDARSIAAGSHDSCVYVFSNLPKNDGNLVWEYVGRLQGHSGPVNGLDWSVEKSADGGYLLRSSSSTIEIMYWRPETLECFYKTEIISKAKWLTYSVLVELSIAGIMTSRFSKVADMTSLDVNHTGTLAASGDTSGNIRLYRYPCSLSGTFCHSYRSHANIHGVRFTDSDKHVMTVGGRDSCLMQWELV